MIDLTPEYLAIVRKILADKVREYEVWVIGSRVSGSAKKYSDLDVALVAEAQIPPGVIEELKDAFAESDLPIQVDVLEWSTLSEAFRRAAERNKVVLQNSSSGRK